MNYTDEQFNALAPYADELRRAIDHNYAHNPGQRALDTIRDTYIAATGVRRYPRNWGCPACIVQLMKDAGRLYFADLDERSKASSAPKKATKKASSAPKKATKKGAKQAERKTPANTEQAPESEK